MKNANSKRIPTQSGVFWSILAVFFIGIMVLTMWKDWWLTGQSPNMLFYLFVPSLSGLCGVISMYGVARFSHHPITFLELLAITVGVNTMMQVMEILLKLVYYRLWEYPGLLYVIIVLPTGILLMVSVLGRWGNVGRLRAIFLTGVNLASDMAMGMFLTHVIGLTTPGS